MKCSIGLSPSRLVPTHFAALLASSGSLRHALPGLLTSAQRLASPRRLKKKRGFSPKPRSPRAEDQYPPPPCG